MRAQAVSASANLSMTQVLSCRARHALAQWAAAAALVVFVGDIDGHLAVRLANRVRACF